MQQRVMRPLGALALALGLGACAGAGSYQTYQDGYDTADLDQPAPAISDAGPTMTIAPGQRPALASDEAGLWMKVEKAEDELRRSGTLVRDPALNAYVREVACKVTGPYCSDIRIYVVRRPGFNATMSPNGAMQLWTGLLLRLENEAQLASVIGHELGHYVRRHSLDRLHKIRNTTDLLAALNIGAAVAGLKGVGTAAGIAAAAGLSAYGRDQEREADGFGVRLLADAGYDPAQTAHLWTRVNREKDAADDEEDGLSFLKTHPSSHEREHALDRLAAAAGGEKGAVQGREAYVKAIAPQRAAWLRDELKRSDFGSKREVLEMLREDDANPAETLYFLGELYRLRGEGGDLRRAAEYYAQAQRAAGEAPPTLYRSAGLVHRRLGQDAAAQRSFSRYLAALPQAPDRAMIEYMMKKG